MHPSRFGILDALAALILAVLITASAGCGRGGDRRAGESNLHGSSRSMGGAGQVAAPQAEPQAELQAAAEADQLPDHQAEPEPDPKAVSEVPSTSTRPADPISDASGRPAGAGDGSRSTERPSRIAAPTGDPAGPARLQPFPGVTIEVRTPRVELDATICLDQGWLEQIACSPGTREHEALLVPVATPSQVHAALLAAGFTAGDPGRWIVEGERVRLLPPSGSRLRIAVRYSDESGAKVEHSVTEWVRDHNGRSEFPVEPWVFGGSGMAPNPEWMGPGEHYVADVTGSIIGLVTFGDEVIGFSRVLSDAAEVHAPEWEADPERMPPVGTRVTIVIEPW